MTQLDEVADRVGDDRIARAEQARRVTDRLAAERKILDPAARQQRHHLCGPAAAKQVVGTDGERAARRVQFIGLAQADHFEHHRVAAVMDRLGQLPQLRQRQADVLEADVAQPGNVANLPVDGQRVGYGHVVAGQHENEFRRQIAAPAGAVFVN